MNADALALLRHAADAPPPAALDRLAHAFDLSGYEIRAVMLCLAYELAPEIAGAVALLSGDARPGGIPTALLHAVLEETDWRATSPPGALRRWRILKAEAGIPRAHTRLRLADTVTDALTGTLALDEALDPVLAPLPDSAAPRGDDVEVIGAALARREPDGLSPILVAPWSDGMVRAATALRALGLVPYRIEPARLAARVESVFDLQRIFERDCALRPAALVAETPADPACQDALAAFLDGLAAHAVIVGDSAPTALRRATFRLPRRPFHREEAVALWKDALGPLAAARLNGSVERAAAHFELPGATIRRTADAVRADVEDAASTRDAEAAFWSAAARAAWPEPGTLARTIEPRARFDDLVVPAGLRADLGAIVRQVRHAGTVFGDWGFEQAGSRGRGSIALFSGPSGTGKTLAAEAIASALHLPLVIADFSQLQSKWVGETPKLAARLFDDLDRGGAVLLIDEAEGLIGRRGAVVEAHDRYANAETGYFLQRLEAFRGLAILTTNMKAAIDDAFLRRFRFVLKFPVPSQEERMELWRRAFPPAAPRGEFNITAAARLTLTGGAIRNIALNAAFLAAEDGAAISERHIASALRAEYRKLERPMAELDIGGFA